MRSQAQLERAVAVSDAATCLEHVEAALVFGSVARGSADEASDIDVLFVTEHPMRASDLVERLAPRCDLEAVALSVKSWNRLVGLRDAGSMFFRHLQVEGKILVDSFGRLASLLAPPIIQVDVATHRHALAKSLALYDDTTRLANFHVFALAHIYVLGKRAAQLCLQEIGEDVYEPAIVFREVGALHPDLKDGLERLESLRWAYTAARASSDVPPHVAQFGDARALEAAQATVRQLLHL